VSGSAINRVFFCSVKVNQMTTIYSLTTSFYVSQTTISLSSTKSTHNDDDKERPAVNGRGEKHGHHYGGAAFMQNVVKALQSFGLNMPAQNGEPGTDDEVETGVFDGQDSSSNLGQLLQTFLQDLRQVLKQSGLQQSVAVQVGDASVVQAPPKQISPSAVPSAPASTAQSGQATSSTVQNNAGTQTTQTPAAAASVATVTGEATAKTYRPRARLADVGEALHSFLHELRQALKQSTNPRHRSDDDGEYVDKAIGRKGYGKFTDNLQNLITALNNSSDQADEKYKELQDSFNDLLNLLGTPPNGKKPTLLEFLNKLAGNDVTNTPPPNVKGAILSATA
jgi:hypothetical protein